MSTKSGTLFRLGHFEHEVVPAEAKYPAPFHILPLVEQARRLRKLFPNPGGQGTSLGDFNQTMAEQPLPKGAEGLVLTVRWYALVNSVDHNAHSLAIEKVFGVLKAKRRFINYCQGKLGLDFLRRSRVSETFIRRTGQDQKGPNLLVLPVQFGLRHAGRSVRCVRELTRDGEVEAPLSVLDVAIMLAIHKDRLTDEVDLCVDCPGSEFGPTGQASFLVPYFAMNAWVLSFSARRIDVAHPRHGSMTAFRATS